MVDGWAYEDGEQTKFAYIAKIMNFALLSFDDFLDSMPDGITKQDLLDWRQQAFNAFKAGNALALKGWLQAMYVGWKLNLTIDGIQPRISMSLEHSRVQSDKGTRGAAVRWGLGEDGPRMTEIIRKLAQSPEHKDETAPDLWGHLYAELDALHLNPVEHSGSDNRKASYTCDGGGKITYGSFANDVSKFREKS